ncbi:Ppx/GppA family phosphatase [Pelagibius litoralis]|uniref:Ppx/GppA family phosphatase n=1 Tax=Pelagibius litoralis TaxID=374515 RepID=A0A967KBB5_9PROT|nr:Ppx/GppA family phosphatase [Pelagibius litoralis]NIA70274.1 Ppx/GppA family phosphatase [Pelagibius litoralis]
MVAASRATVSALSKATVKDGRIAVVDIGSNSIRLVVFDGLKRAPATVFNEKVLCGLGRGLQSSGQLNPEGVALAVPNLVRFTALARAMGIEKVDLIATAAVRDAADGPDFVATVEEACGHPIRVLSGAEEAQLSALGVIAGNPEADGIMGDLGGGSLELVEINHGEIGRATTLALGPLRLMESCGDDRQMARSVIDKTLAKVAWLGAGHDRAFYPVGGAWRNLARLHIEQMRHPLHAIHGHTIASEEALRLARLVSRQGKSSLSGIEFISRRRRETLPLGALVLGRLLRIAGSSEISFSTYGLREGYLFNQLSKQHQAEDPLISSASEIAEREGRFGGLGEGLMRWCDALFPGESDEERRLRLATCHLSDFAWREHPDFRASHALRRILHHPFVSIDHPGRSFLAYTIFLRYGGAPDSRASSSATALLSERWRERASLLGAALRLAFRVSGATRDILDGSRLNVDGAVLELILPGDGSVPDGEAVQRRLRALAAIGGFKEARIVV